MPFILAVLMSVVLVATTGCTSRDPMEQPISVPTPVRFAAWRSHVGSDSNPELRRRLDTALQEIRMNAAAEREIKRGLGEKTLAGSEALEEVVRQRVHGRRIREVLQLGTEYRVRRLKEELAGLEDAMKQYDRLVTRPGDLDSRHHLEGLRERQTRRVEQYREDVAAAERELAPLLAKSGRRFVDISADVVDSPPIPLKQR